MFWWVPSGTTFCQSLHWQIRDGDSHKVPKGFDLFHEKLGMHCLDVAYFAIVFGFVCIPMLVVVVHTGLT